MEPKHPEIKVQLTGEDGNAFLIIGRITREMKRAKLSKEEIEAFQTEATSGDYDHLLQTAMKYVDVC